MTENTPQENVELLNGSEQNDPLKALHDTAMTKLKEAIDLNKKSRKKEAWQAKEEACALLLVGLRAGVQFDLNDPVFQIFVQKQSWRDAMERACKDVCDRSSNLARNVRKIISLLPSIPIPTPTGIVIDFNIGEFVDSIFGFFGKDSKTAQEELEAYNRDTWHDFYEDIPKDDGNGPFIYRGLGKFKLAQAKTAPNNKLQAFLAQKMMTLSHKNAHKSGIQKYLSNRMITPDKNIPSDKNQKTLSKKGVVKAQQLTAWTKKQSTNNAA